MMAVAVSALAVGGLSEAQRACVGELNAYLGASGVGCYYGSSNAQLGVLESFFEGLANDCDLTNCRCDANATESATCDGFATASLVGYINIHSKSAPTNALYDDMKRIVSNTCLEATQEGVPPAPLLSQSYGACGVENVVSAHTGGIGAYVAVYAALFALVMLESQERSRYVPVASEEPELPAKPATTAKTSTFL